MPRKKRYKKRYKRRSYSRKTMSMKKCCPKPEVKYCDITIENQGILNNDYHSSAIDFLPGSSNYLSNLLSYIVIGPNRNQRIGQKITLKAIRWTFHIWPCITATAFLINYVTVRIIIGSWNNAAANDVPKLFPYSANNIWALPLNRETYNISYDKVLNKSFNWTTASVGTGITTGGTLLHTHYQRFNDRQVIYTGNVPKHEEDQFSLGIIGTMVAASTQPQAAVACMHGRFRVYFTDS